MRAAFLRPVASVVALSCLALVGCAGSENSPVAAGVGNGGATSNVGATTTPATGGQRSEGGAVGQGSARGAGGAPDQGGASGQGAESEQGGSADPGGQGGVTTSVGGRRTATGGSATGVRSAGGTTNGSGGKSAGGSKAAGGAATGGKTSRSTKTTTGGATGSTNPGTGGKADGGSGIGGTSSDATTPIKLWIAGDSTVQKCSGTCPCGWGSQFAPLFKSNVTVVNSAVGGRSIQTWLFQNAVSSTMGSNGECTLTSTAYDARWTAMTNPNTGMKAGDYLFIQFGINDGDSTCPRHVGTALYKTYLGDMAKAAKALGATPILLTPASMIKCSGNTAVGSRGFLTETKAAGTANDVAVIDLHQLTVDKYNQLGLCPESGDYTSTTSAVGKFFCEDHTHFEAAGAKVVAQEVAKALKDQSIGLAAYLL